MELAEGGVKQLDIALEETAFQLRWITRLIDTTELPWKHLVRAMMAEATRQACPHTTDWRNVLVGRWPTRTINKIASALPTIWGSAPGMA